MTEEHSYEEGVRDGRIAHLELLVGETRESLKSHEKRLVYLERIAASMLAILAFTSILPKLVEFISAVQ
jgi:hypothetical protein